MADEDIQEQLDHIVRLLTQGDAASAEKLASRCTSSHPESPDAWFLLGASKHLLLDYGEALAAFDRAQSLHPAHLQSLRAKATVLSQLGRTDEALSICERAAQIAPHDADITANLGTALEAANRLEEALWQFDRALALDPHHIVAILNRGALLLRMQRLHEALDNNRKFIELHPGFADAYFNLSEVLFALHRHEEALAVCDSGLSVMPRHARLHLNRGIALAALKRFQESQAEIAQAQMLDPELCSGQGKENAAATDRSVNAEIIYLQANNNAQRDCHWENLPQYLETLEQFVAQATPSGIVLHDKALALPLLSLALTPENRLRIMRQISEYVQDTAWLYGVPPFRHMRRSRGKIRIGYMSPDFRDHPVGHLTKQLYGLHNRQEFEIHGYALRLEENDAVQQTIASNCDVWHDLSRLDNPDAARKIYDDGIDILIDLAGYTQHSRPELLALRPAPVQAHYLGYPGTMGADFMDYAILDETVCPASGKPHLAESPVLLPGAYCPYDTTTPNAPTEYSRVNFGLPEQGFVFCCFSATYKVEPTMFAVWLRLLQQVPGSVLWFASRATLDIVNLRREAARQGIAPARLVGAPHIPRNAHLQRFQLADLFLDTRWHNAHTMAADALWQGLPVLTCAGEHWSSRLAASLLTAADLPELITHSLEEYESKAVALASRPSELAKLKTELAITRDSSALFSPRKTVCSLEQAYRIMWDKWLAGDRPAKISVPADVD